MAKPRFPNDQETVFHRWALITLCLAQVKLTQRLITENNDINLLKFHFVPKRISSSYLKKEKITYL